MKNIPKYTQVIKHYEQWLTDQTHFTEVTNANYFRWACYFLNYLTTFNVLKLNDVDNDIIYQFTHFRKDKSTGEIKPYAKASVKSRLAALDLFFTWTYEHGHCRENPILRYKKWQLKGKPLAKAETPQEDRLVVLSAQEQQLLQQLKTDLDDTLIRNKCIVLTILASALFAEEVITLPLSHFCLNKGYLLIDDRTVPLDLALCQAACHAWLTRRKELLGKEKQPLVFFNQSLQPLSKRMLYKIVSETLSIAGITKQHQGPDMLRQTAICNFLGKYAREDVEKITGIKNLQHYRV